MSKQWLSIPSESHTYGCCFANPFGITYLQNQGGGGGCPSDFQLQTDHPTRMVVPSERSESRDLPSNLQSAILRTETEPWIVEKSSAWPFALSGATSCAPR